MTPDFCRPVAGRRLSCCGLLLFAASLFLLPSGVVAGRKSSREQGVTFRVRCVRITPSVPVRIHCRWGGEGLGGKVNRYELTRFTFAQPDISNRGMGKDGDDILDEIEGKPTDRVITSDKTYRYHWLKPGTWSAYHPLTSIHSGFVTFTLAGYQAEAPLKDGVLEFEFAHKGKTIRRFQVAGPDGPTFGVYLPRLTTDAKGVPTPESVAQLAGLKEYIQKKYERVHAALGDGPTPKRYAIVTDCRGYRDTGGNMVGYGCRTADKDTMLAEFEILRLIGVNSMRGSPSFVMDLIRKQEGMGQELDRAYLGSVGGYPIPKIRRADGRPPEVFPGAGCPYDPKNLAAAKKAAAARIKAELAEIAKLPVEEVWALTVDEIGSIFDGAPEGKAHMGACPYCRKAFREMVRGEGRTLADFGAKDWQEIRALYGYWGRSYWEIRRERKAALDNAMNALKKEQQKGMEGGLGDLDEDDPDNDVIDQLDADIGKKKKKKNVGTGVTDAKKRWDQLIWNPRAGQPKNDDKKIPLSPSGLKLLQYYSRRFNNESSARAFQALQEALEAANDEKRKALENDPDSPAAQRPWVYSYALRGNTFLMRGHSLDFFDFYRFADNAFVYETSNRDYRVWQWDSYLCDVGRSLSRFRNKRFGIYVKPHRGASMQRALSAAARGARMIYWYTYGPEWSKGDTFGNRLDAVINVGKTGRLLAAAEDVTYDADWAVPAEIALVRPNTSEYLGNSAGWENGKWVYTALMHAHLPVDALDEVLLLKNDLSHYKVIYVSGSHIRGDAAAKLETWVKRGGTLYTCGGGLARNEANLPLTKLLPVLGLRTRDPVEHWADVKRYGATKLPPLRPHKQQPPASKVRLSGKAPFQGAFVPAVGREVLQPVDSAEVLAAYADGSAAVVKNGYGKGQAITVGTYAGLEYANDAMQQKPYDADKRSYVAAPAAMGKATPVVDAAVPTVEGVLLKHRTSGKRAVILMNWSFKGRQIIPAEGMTLKLRGLGEETVARSIALHQDLPIIRTRDTGVITLPRLLNGDILLLKDTK